MFGQKAVFTLHFHDLAPKKVVVNFTALCLWDVLDTSRVVILSIDTYPPRPTRKDIQALEVLIFGNNLRGVCRHIFAPLKTQLVDNFSFLFLFHQLYDTNLAGEAVKSFSKGVAKRASSWCTYFSSEILSSCLWSGI